MLLFTAIHLHYEVWFVMTRSWLVVSYYLL